MSTLYGCVGACMMHIRKGNIRTYAYILFLLELVLHGHGMINQRILADDSLIILVNSEGAAFSSNVSE